MPSDALVESLVSYLQRKKGSASDCRVTDLVRSGGGNSRENWVFTVAWSDGDTTHQERLILRRDPLSGPFESSRRTEFDVLFGLRAADKVPVPKPLWVEEDGGDLERPFLIMEFVEGDSDRELLLDESRPIESRVTLAQDYTDILASLHKVDWRTHLPTLRPPTVPAAQAELERWLPDFQGNVNPGPIVERAVSWLMANRPDSPNLSLAHGDFRPGNSLVKDGHVATILDWELAHICDPYCDLGWYISSPWYDDLHFIPDRFTREDFIERYGDRSNVTIDADRLHYWQVLNELKRVAMRTHRLTYATPDEIVMPPELEVGYLRNVLDAKVGHLRW